MEMWVWCRKERRTNDTVRRAVKFPEEERITGRIDKNKTIGRGKLACSLLLTCIGGQTPRKNRNEDIIHVCHA